MSLIPFRKKPEPVSRVLGPLVLSMPKPVDERDRDDAIIALEQLNAEFDDICRSEVRLADRKRRVILAREARRAQLDVLEFEKFAAVGREVERSLNDEPDAPVEPGVLESEMTIVETRVAAE